MWGLVKTSARRAARVVRTDPNDHARRCFEGGTTPKRRHAVKLKRATWANKGSRLVPESAGIVFRVCGRHCPSRFKTGIGSVLVHRIRGSGSGWSSDSAVRTGRLRRSRAVHFRPIDLVVFQEPTRNKSAGNLVLEGASRLDAFSAYPVPTWLPGDAPSGTAGTPEVGPPQSSRTRGDSPQVSYAHGR